MQRRMPFGMPTGGREGRRSSGHICGRGGGRVVAWGIYINQQHGYSGWAVYVKGPIRMATTTTETKPHGSIFSPIAETCEREGGHEGAKGATDRSWKICSHVRIRMITISGGNGDKRLRFRKHVITRGSCGSKRHPGERSTNVGKETLVASQSVGGQGRRPAIRTASGAGVGIQRRTAALSRFLGDRGFLGSMSNSTVDLDGGRKKRRKRRGAGATINHGAMPQSTTANGARRGLVWTPLGDDRDVCTNPAMYGIAGREPRAEGRPAAGSGDKPGAGASGSKKWGRVDYVAVTYGGGNEGSSREKGRITFAGTNADGMGCLRRRMDQAEGERRSSTEQPCFHGECASCE